ncbi:MarC family protein [Desulfosarcina cetonica]|uniref:MarC family protein n=1 Tax=Desulfosarcina cetonica TaxID=90730 RepID=UPI00248AD98E|nr:MarC family protein [Desulfosarcina cetonica]
MREFEQGGGKRRECIHGSRCLGIYGLLRIMNPIANTPVFLGLTAGNDPATMRRIAAKALTISFVIIVVFSAGGKLIFDLFGITLSAFRIMGGILVALVGYQMLHGGEHSSVQHPSEEDKRKSLDAELEVAITPLAMPILAGPGTIATAMNFASGGGVSEFIVTVGAFVLLCIITYAFFVSGKRMVKYIGDNGIKVVTRLMGLILAVIGVQMLIQGVGGAVTEFLKIGGVG